jgi:hypothetical protein
MAALAAPSWAADAARSLGVSTDSVLLHTDLDALATAPMPFPPNVDGMHKVGLTGPFLVQVQEVRQLQARGALFSAPTAAVLPAP